MKEYIEDIFGIICIALIFIMLCFSPLFLG